MPCALMSLVHCPYFDKSVGPRFWATKRALKRVNYIKASSLYVDCHQQFFADTLPLTKWTTLLIMGCNTRKTHTMTPRNPSSRHRRSQPRKLRNPTQFHLTRISGVIFNLAVPPLLASTFGRFIHDTPLAVTLKSIRLCFLDPKLVSELPSHVDQVGCFVDLTRQM